MNVTLRICENGRCRVVGSGQSFDFPTHSTAILKTPYVDSVTGVKVTAYQLMPNNTWQSRPGGHQYFTSFDKLQARHPISEVRSPAGVLLQAAASVVNDAAGPHSPAQAADAAAAANSAVTPQEPRRTGEGRSWWLWGLGGAALAALALAGWLAARKA